MNSTYKVIAALTGQRNIIPIPILYVRAFGSYEAAAMLTQLTYWDDRLTPDRNGWQYRTEDDWREELAFTRRDLEGARKALLKAEVIEYKLMGIPAKAHYKVKRAELAVFLTELCAEQDCTVRTNLGVRSEQSITEPTAEPTTLHIGTGQTENEEERDQPSVPPRSSSTSQRQKFAIQASQEKSARKKLEEMLGERYKYAQVLVNKHGTKPDTLFSRLSASPSLLSTFLSTENDVFEATLERAKEQAARHTSGWESNVGAQFLSLLAQGHKPGDLSRQQGGGGLVDQRWTISDRMYAGQLRRGIAHYGGLLERGEPSPSMDLTQMASHVAYLKQELGQLEGKYADQSGQPTEKE